MPDLLHEVFDVWAGQAVEGFEAKRGIFGDAGPAEQLCCAFAFCDSDLLGAPLDLGDWEMGRA